MKNKRLLLLLILSALCLSNLLADPEAKITFHIITDEGKPLVDFPYQAGSSLTHPAHLGSLDNTVNVSGITDKNGDVSLTLSSATGEIYSGTRYGMKGYYAAGIKYQFTNSAGDKWQPWNPTLELVVKPIINPIPMYACNVGLLGQGLQIPVKNAPVGFDLEANDWVVPYGKGTTADFIFTMTEKVPFVKYNQPFDLTWTISFSNKGDGIQAVKSPSNPGNFVRMLCNAPQSGYGPTLVQELARNGAKALNGDSGEDQNYFFRVRSVLDERGNVKSALYGKILGTIRYWGDSNIHFTYYLNPNPNDRNMESDPSKNLFQNLPDDQQVHAP
jgi:hypothetical protein